MHLSCIKVSTISKRTEQNSTRPSSRRSTMRCVQNYFMSLWYVQYKPCTYLASRLALSPNGPKRAPPDPRHLGVPSGTSKMIYQPMVHLTQTEHLSCTDANTVSKIDQNKIPHDPPHLGVPSGASNTIFEPTVCSTQTVHQSCIKSSTISKRTKLSFHLSLVTKESHRVCLK
jgi:hypothetical protein